jgi:hypothetical protein
MPKRAGMAVAGLIFLQGANAASLDDARSASSDGLTGLQLSMHLGEKRSKAPAALPLFQETEAEEQEKHPVLKLSGYYKALLIHSQLPYAPNDPYDLALNRLRLKMTYNVPSLLELHVEHDTEFKSGNYLKTGLFRQQKNMTSQQYWQGESNFADNARYYGTQRFFRAYAKFSRQDTDLTFGRQRIPLGTGRFWSALDMLNPVNPLQVERDEPIGVDGVLLEQKMGALSKVNIIYAPDPARKQDSWIGQYRTNHKGTDVTLTYGKYWGDHVAGIDFATQIGDAGLRGEWTYTSAQIGHAYQKALLGFDYAFPNTLSFSTEAYYSGQRKEDRLAQFVQNPLLAQLQPLDNVYLGFSAGVEFNPLLKFNTYLLLNMKDHSRFLFPSLSYSISDEASMMGGAQFFSGRADSEYGRGSDTYFLQFQYFF